MSSTSKGFPHTLTGLSDRLLALSTDALGDGIQASLADLGQICSAGRVYVFLLSRDGQTLDQAYEWCAPGVTGHDFSSFRGVPVSAFPWSMGQFLRGRIVYVRDSSLLPAEAIAERNACAALNIGAYVNLPLALENELVGWLGFDVGEPEPPWGGEDLELMRLAGRMLIRTIGRARREESLIAERATSRRLAALGVFAAGLGHEVNNPLAYASLNLEMLQNHLTEQRADAETMKYLRHARHGMDRIAETVQSLRSFARETHSTPIPMHVGHAIDSSLKLLMPRIALRAQLERVGNEDVWVKAGPAELGQVIANIVRNSIENLPEGRAKEHVIRILTTRVEDRVTIQCTDSGPGFPEEVLPHVFEPFFTTRQDEGGSGIGLALCYSIIAELNGTLIATNLPEGGACLRFELPGVDPPSSEAQEAPTFPVQNCRVLIVDDDAMLREILSLTLTDCDLVTAQDGFEAISILKRDTEWDLILCDVLMPNGTGRDVYEYLSASAPSLLEHFVFITGGPDSNDTAQFLARVPNEILSKPIATDLLRATVDKFARKRP